MINTAAIHFHNERSKLKKKDSIQFTSFLEQPNSFEKCDHEVYELRCFDWIGEFPAESFSVGVQIEIQTKLQMEIQTKQLG